MTDGTVIPQDLNLGWAISKKKQDYLGMKFHERPFSRIQIERLVGLLTEDSQMVLLREVRLQRFRRKGGGRPIGHVTSTYFSPTLGYSIAMALLEGGLDKLGERVSIPSPQEKLLMRK